jgi:CRISPR-associated protein Cmx8
MSEETIDLRYDLYSLPTAQHKAGLAGLCVLHDTLRRRKVGPLPEIVFPEEGIVRLSLTNATLETLFNDLYDAAYKETPRRKQLKDKNKNELKCLREEIRKEPDPKTGKEKEVTFYIYEDVVPKCAFLDSLQVSEPWLKLWRDALWNTLRGKPTTRTPYNERADGKPVNEVAKTWKSLQKYQKKPLATEEIASSIYIGAQAINAEKVPFVGRIDENLLLHFWQVVMRIFVPEIINNEGKADFKGYVLAIPEVCDVEGFLEDFSLMVSQLKTDLKGYRPAESVISVPQEGALEYIAALVRNKAQDGNLAYNISSVEVVHLEKRSNNITMLSSSRLPVDDAVRGKYESIRSGHYRHPLFKLQIILLDGKDWYSGFDRAFSSHDKDWFLGFKTWFPIDVRSHFKLMNQ